MTFPLNSLADLSVVMLSPEGNLVPRFVKMWYPLVIKHGNGWNPLWNRAFNVSNHLEIVYFPYKWRFLDKKIIYFYGVFPLWNWGLGTSSISMVHFYGSLVHGFQPYFMTPEQRHTPWVQRPDCNGPPCYYAWTGVVWKSLWNGRKRTKHKGKSWEIIGNMWEKHQE